MTEILLARLDDVNFEEIPAHSLDVHANGVLGATKALDFSLASVQTATLGEATTISFVNWPASGRLGRLELRLTQGASPFAVTWPPEVNWGGLGAPDLSIINVTYVLVFTTLDAGAAVQGFRVPGEF